MNVRPDAAALADEAGSWRSAYLHVPFCARRCPYCDFAVVAAGEPGSGDTGRYVDALIAEIRFEDAPFPLDAVNFGGGTPTRLEPEDLSRILAALDDRFGTGDDSEISIEANPEDWSPGYGAALHTAGFDRVSFGVQSFDPEVLAYLGRAHTPLQAERAVLDARTSGFSTINIDVIFGSPVETRESWEATVDRTLALEPEHLSAYALTVEGGTTLSRAVNAGADAPDPDTQADRYEYLADRARDAGLVRYEISNWAKPGHACRYNLSTWNMGEYVAFGTGAHDHRRGVRSRNVRRIDAYLSRVEHAERPRSGHEHLTPCERERERFMVGLRLAAGVATGTIGEAFLASPDGLRLVDAGVIASSNGRVVVLRPLLTDLVARSVLSVPTDDC